MHRWVPGASACAWLLSCLVLPSGSARADIAPGAYTVSSDYLLGMEALDRGRLDEAIAVLERVVAADPGFSGARMELARAQFASGNYARADSEFRYLLAQSPPARVRAVIQRYLDAIPGRSLLARSRWSGALQLGAGYDSNANGSTSDETFLGFTLNPRNVETGSPFGELTASGGQSMRLAPSVGLVNSLQFSHRTNPDASFVDQSTVSLGSAVLWPGGAYRFNAGVDAHWSWLDAEVHDRGFNLGGGVSRSFGVYDASLSFRAGDVSYRDATLDILDVRRFLTGVSVTRSDLLGYPVRGGVALFGGTDHAKASGSPYGNNRFGARAFGTWQLRPDSAVYGELSNLRTHFDGDFFASDRRDRQFALSVSYERQGFPAAGWSVAPRLRYVHNDSTIALYEYDRLEAMVFIRRSFQRDPVRTAQIRLASVQPSASVVARDTGQASSHGSIAVASGRPAAADRASSAEGASAIPHESAWSPDALTAVPQTASALAGVTTRDFAAAPGPEPSFPRKPERRIEVVSPLGMHLDVTHPSLPGIPRVATAISVPGSSRGPFTASTTEPHDTFEFGAGGSLMQFNESFGNGSTLPATYLAGNAAPLDFGSNGASGIRWGRWSMNDASVMTTSGAESLDLRHASLHWIAGPLFEVSPVIPVSGSINFVLAGGTSPTDNLGNVGTLAAGVLTADFTHQQVRTQLSVDVNGYNWFATGSGPLTPSSRAFSGTFGTVLVDGRIAGSGEFSGFLSAGALTPDQINGVGLSYRLSSSAHGLGDISGVAAFVPGGVYPLVPPVVQRDIAYAAGHLFTRDIVGATTETSTTQLALDPAGNIRRFHAPVPGSMNGTLALGMAANVDAGFHAATGLRWGRWTGDAIDLTVPPGSSVSSDFSNRSLHWIVGNEFASPPVLPQTGTASYALVGHTNPTDTLGRVGSLGSASFEANFTTRSVTSEMTLTVGGLDWYARGEGTWSIGENNFTGSYHDVQVQNIARGRGMMYGFFTMPRALGGTTPGAGLSFSITDNFGQLGVVSGALAFAESTESVDVTPPALRERDVAYISPDANQPAVHRQAANDYSLDANFNLTGFAGRVSAVPAEPARYTIGTTAVAESGAAPAALLRWGRWAGGEIDVLNLASDAPYTIDATQRSLHWVESADSVAAPVMPMFGTANYTLAGGTAPTDQFGNTGVLRQADLAADFTNQLVSTTLSLSIDNVDIVATGNGSIGAAAGLPAHHFIGAMTGGTVNTTPGNVQGTFSGFFTAPGTTPGIPAGVGLTYSIDVDAGARVMDGAAALRP
jgi:hypothetical protein